jgi:septum site-determining protein MinC
MPPPSTAKPAFDLKSTAWTLPALRLQTADLGALEAALAARFGQGGLFDGDPVVIDLSPLRESSEALDVAGIAERLRACRMWPVAVQGGSSAHTAAARAAGLAEALDAAPFPAASAPALASAPAPEAAPVAPPEAGPERGPTMVIDKPLRSGQRVYARGCDLVVLAAVSFGAEVIADGNIHVYAPLRGRAMAGARGDIGARIYTTCLEAQLVSVAGIYRTTETPLPAAVLGQAAQVRLVGEKLLLERLGA